MIARNSIIGYKSSFCFLYIGGSSNSIVSQFALSESDNLNTLSYTERFATDINIRGAAVTNSGKTFITYNSDATFKIHTLPDRYFVDSKVLQTTTPPLGSLTFGKLSFTHDGLGYIIITGDRNVYVYSSVIPFDVENLLFRDSKTNYPFSMKWAYLHPVTRSPFYLHEPNTEEAYLYYYPGLSPYVLPTNVISSTFLDLSTLKTPTESFSSFTFSKNGLQLFLRLYTRIVQYNLNRPFDLNSASFFTDVQIPAAANISSSSLSFFFLED